MDNPKDPESFFKRKLMHLMKPEEVVLLSSFEVGATSEDLW